MWRNRRLSHKSNFTLSAQQLHHHHNHHHHGEQSRRAALPARLARSRERGRDWRFVWKFELPRCGSFNHNLPQCLNARINLKVRRFAIYILNFHVKVLKISAIWPIPYSSNHDWNTWKDSLDVKDLEKLETRHFKWDLRVNLCRCRINTQLKNKLGVYASLQMFTRT